MCCGQAKPLLDAKQVKEIADPRLEDQYDPVEMEIAMATASMCIHHMSSKRPYMSQVTKITDLININPFFEPNHKKKFIQETVFGVSIG